MMEHFMRTPGRRREIVRLGKHSQHPATDFASKLPLMEVKQTRCSRVSTAAFDPKRTFDPIDSGMG